MQIGRTGRQVETGALAAFAPLVVVTPIWLAVMVVIWWATSAVHNWSFSWFAGVYALIGLLLFWRPFQRLVLLPLVGARRPTPDEFAILSPLWREVTQVAGQSADRYELSVLPYDEINAFACGGSLVVVTSLAIESLPDAELAGVLAHELSHHLGLHTVALTLAQWLSLPVVLLARLGFYLQSVAQAATDTFARRSEGATAIGTVVAVALRAVASVLRLGLVAANALGNAVSKGSEFQADARAVGLGYGPHLAAALRRFVANERATSANRSWSDRLFAAHPPARTRIARIEALGRRNS